MRRPHANRRNQRRIAADENAIADRGRVLRRAVVVAGDRPRADIRISSHRRVAQIGQVHGFRAFAHHACSSLPQNSRCVRRAEYPRQDAAAKTAPPAPSRRRGSNPISNARQCSHHRPREHPSAILPVPNLAARRRCAFFLAIARPARSPYPAPARDLRIDHHRLRQINRHARRHQLRRFACAENAVYVREMQRECCTREFRSRLAPPAPARVRCVAVKNRSRPSDKARDGNYPGAARSGRPKLRKREAINAGIHFADRALLGRCRFLFDNRLHAPFGIAYHAAIICRIVQFGAQNSGRCLAAAVRVEQRRQSFRRAAAARRREPPPQISRSCGSRAAPLALRALCRAAAAAAPFARPSPSPARPLLPPDVPQPPESARLQRLARPNHMFEQRPSTGAMQHFRQLGTHARPFARGQNHNHSVICGSHRSQPLSPPHDSLAIRNRDPLTFHCSSDNHSIAPLVPIAKFAREKRRQEHVLHTLRRHQLQ